MPEQHPTAITPHPELKSGFLTLQHGPSHHISSPQSSQQQDRKSKPPCSLPLARPLPRSSTTHGRVPVKTVPQSRPPLGTAHPQAGSSKISSQKPARARNCPAFSLHSSHLLPLARPPSSNPGKDLIRWPNLSTRPAFHSGRALLLSPGSRSRVQPLNSLVRALKRKDQLRGSNRLPATLQN